MVKSGTQIRPKQWNRKNLKALLKRCRGKKILVIGDVGVDRYTYGSVERISPEAPVPIVRVEKENLKLGLAANVADNVKVLGGEPLLVGVVGRDRNADDFKRLLRSARISDRHLVTDRKRRTALKERLVTESQQLLRVDYESQTNVPATVQKQLLNRIRPLVKKADAIVIEDYGKGLVTGSVVRGIFSLAKKAGKMTLVDPSARTRLSYYKGSHILTPNKKEAEALVGKQVSSTGSRSLINVGSQILSEAGAQHVLMTLGKDGMAIFSKGKQQFRMIPTTAQEVYDVSGAGDTVVSMLALVLSAGGSIEEAAVLGNIAAGVEVSKRGTATVKPNEIIEAMESVL